MGITKTESLKTGSLGCQDSWFSIWKGERGAAWKCLYKYMYMWLICPATVVEDDCAHLSRACWEVRLWLCPWPEHFDGTESEPLIMAWSRLQLCPENWVWVLAVSNRLVLWWHHGSYALHMQCCWDGITGSNNCKMSQCGRDHKNHLISTTPPWAGMPPMGSRLPKAPSSLASENDLFPESQAQPHWALDPSPSLWEGSMGTLLFCLSHTFYTPMPNLCIFSWMWTIAPNYWILWSGRKHSLIFLCWQIDVKESRQLFPSSAVEGLSLVAMWVTFLPV